MSVFNRAKYVLASSILALTISCASAITIDKIPPQVVETNTPQVNETNKTSFSIKNYSTNISSPSWPLDMDREIHDGQSLLKETLDYTVKTGILDPQYVKKEMKNIEYELLIVDNPDKNGLYNHEKNKITFFISSQIWDIREVESDSIRYDLLDTSFHEHAHNFFMSYMPPERRSEFRKRNIRRVKDSINAINDIVSLPRVTLVEIMEDYCTEENRRKCEDITIEMLSFIANEKINPEESEKRIFPDLSKEILTKYDFTPDTFSNYVGYLRSEKDYRTLYEEEFDLLFWGTEAHSILIETELSVKIKYLQQLNDMDQIRELSSNPHDKLNRRDVIISEKFNKSLEKHISEPWLIPQELTEFYDGFINKKYLVGK